MRILIKLYQSYYLSLRYIKAATWVCSCCVIIFLALSTASCLPVITAVRLWSFARLISIATPANSTTSQPQSHQTKASSTAAKCKIDSNSHRVQMWPNYRSNHDTQNVNSKRVQGYCHTSWRKWIKKGKFNLLGNLCRMEDNRLAKEVVHGKMEGKQQLGRPRKEWLDDKGMMQRIDTWIEEKGARQGHVGKNSVVARIMKFSDDLLV